MVTIRIRSRVNGVLYEGGGGGGVNSEYTVKFEIRAQFEISRFLIVHLRSFAANFDVRIRLFAESVAIIDPEDLFLVFKNDKRLINISRKEIIC